MRQYVRNAFMLRVSSSEYGIAFSRAVPKDQAAARKVEDTQERVRHWAPIRKVRKENNETKALVVLGPPYIGKPGLLYSSKIRFE